MLKQILTTLIILLPLFCIGQQTVNSKDSALYKMVKKIRLAIEDRAREVKAITYSLQPNVIFGSQTIPIDSLYKYNIKCVKSISVGFDDDPNLYGSIAYWGVIRIFLKEDVEEVKPLKK